ncbi:unnamed protein product [Cladocopium goreaui]|uniref:Secreted protein n=1 Tax=Cladocopium goreaui TaxID=2562237 RepID=A0A9P1FFY8_9DINO|nr:unnamed protein product [Cladocopium goreaui]
MWYQIVSKVVTSLFLPVAAVAACGWWQAEKTMQAPTWHQSESNKCRARRARRTKHQFWCKKRLQALYSLEKGLRTVASNDSDQCSSRSKVSFAARQSIQCIRRNVGYP